MQDELPQFPGHLNHQDMPIDVINDIELQEQEISDGEYDEDNKEDITEMTALEHFAETLKRAQEMATAAKHERAGN
ncbi:hypothetical protein C0995_010547 [Termitomyces sp. Mi166|nr:hypothetical protein C0995_010547 [Termitomyces sp. Mi166\